MDEKKIVFFSSEDYSDNPRALYEYMIEHGFNEEYSIVWLVHDVERHRRYWRPNVRFVPVRDEKLNLYTLEAQKEVLTAKYIFYSHSLNWCDPVRGNQLYIDLWHGCGYKGQEKGLQRRNFFDYCLVPGEIFIPIKKEFFSCPERKLIPIGYPRYDWFKTEKSNAKNYLENLKSSCGADVSIIWMPTFRKSESENLNDDSLKNETGLPIAGNARDLLRLDAFCAEKKVAIVLKRHMLQAEYDFRGQILKNISIVDSDDLDNANVNLYELLACSDALISDYSSAAIDYLLVDKPLAFTLDDFDEYEFRRGWSFDRPLDYMPGHHVYDISQFEAFIDDVALGRDEYVEARRDIRGKLHNECNNYCGRIVDYFGLKRSSGSTDADIDKIMSW